MGHHTGNTNYSPIHLVLPSTKYSSPKKLQQQKNKTYNISPILSISCKSDSHFKTGLMLNNLYKPILNVHACISAISCGWFYRRESRRCVEYVYHIIECINIKKASSNRPWGGISVGDYQGNRGCTVYQLTECFHTAASVYKIRLTAAQNCTEKIVL